MKSLASPYTFLKHFCFNYYPTMPTLHDIKMDLKSIELTLMSSRK